MIRAVPTLILVFLSISFAAGQDIDRHTENGVEVIMNHIEPYKLKNAPPNLSLEEEFTIDLGDDAIASLGLFDILDIDIDSQGNIYNYCQKCREKAIFKFDGSGKFVASFGRIGQGPGEFQFLVLFKINNHDEIIVQNIASPKLMFLSSIDGRLIKSYEIPSALRVHKIKQMKSGNYVVYHSELRRESADHGYRKNIWSLFSPEFIRIKEILSVSFDGDLSKLGYELPKEYVTDDSIYIGKRADPYEIDIYDADGNLKKIIKKQYKPVKMTEEYRNKRIKYIEDMGKKGIPPPPGALYFPDYFPPFEDFFVDDDGRIFVRTNEKSEKPDELFVYDIFNPDGVFIAKKSLSNGVQARNGRLYAMSEENDGTLKVIGYRMKWE